MGSSKLLTALSFAAAVRANAVPMLGEAHLETQNQPRQAGACADVHIFLARGNNEPYPGRQGALVSAICDGLCSCDYEDLIYSALYTDLYCQTVYDGAIAGHVQMAKYASRCPNSKLILSGYSQGGQVATDILGGGGGTLFNGCGQPSTPPLDRSNAPGKNLVAVLSFGDVRHTANQPYNFGDGSGLDGVFPRSEDQLNALLPYAPIMRDWCDAADDICAYNHGNPQTTNPADHLNYFNVDTQSAAAWVKQVAGLTNSCNVQTFIPTSVSGTVQDYRTVPTGTPSGTVVLNTVWQQETSVTGGGSAPTTSATPSGTVTVTSTPVSQPTTVPTVSGTTVAVLGVGNTISVSTTLAAGNATMTAKPTFTGPVVVGAGAKTGVALSAIAALAMSLVFFL